MSEDDYYHGVDVGIDLYMDRALKAEATATRRKELLRRYQDYAEFILDFEKKYPAPGGWIDKRKKLLVLMSEVEEELENDSNT